MLHLLTVPEEEVATTLLILPFAFPGRITLPAVYVMLKLCRFPGIQRLYGEL